MDPQQRIIYYIDYLKDTGRIRFRKQFFDDTGIRRQYFNAVRAGNSRFTTDHIMSICKHYPLNVNWVFGLEDHMERITIKIKPHTTRTQNNPHNKNQNFLST